MPTQTNDPAAPILSAATGLNNEQRAAAWDAFHHAANQDDLAKTLQGMNIPQSVKAELWDAKHASSDVVTIGGQQVNLRTGAGASAASSAQAQQSSDASVRPINRTSGLLVSGPKTVPADEDVTGTIAPSAGASSGLGLMGNLIGPVRTQSTQQQQQNAKNSAIAAGMALVPEAIPELAGGGIGSTLANVGIRAANAGISSAGGSIAGQALVGENRRVSTSLRPVVMEFREFFHLC
jgi:hypothetical protein